MRFFNKSLWLALLALLLMAPQAAQAAPRTPQDSLALADSLYERNQFALAQPIYQSLLRGRRVASIRMLNRMAMAEESAGHVPESLYYFSILYAQAPDEAVRTRMESLARQYQLEGYDYDEWDFLRKLLSSYAVYLFGGLVLVMLMLLGAMARRRIQRRPLRLLPLGLLLLLGLASFLLNTDFTYGKGIVVGGQALLMDAPSAAGKLQTRVPPGTRLTVLGKRDIWMRVVYGNHEGYVNGNLVWYF